jgi:hypothetical protein
MSVTTPSWAERENNTEIRVDRKKNHPRFILFITPKGPERFNSVKSGRPG